ncbi:MAG: PRC-barrel domain containing protein [Desulfobacteraceae bacterium]|nr:MAG: PRC-barrel domain containing protein [Desulfobacteraceae bacterium]
MKKAINLFILLLLTLLLAGNSFAQQQQSGQEQPMKSQQNLQGQQNRKQQQKSQSGQQLQWAQKSSDVLDKKIFSSDGKELGTAEDLIIGKDGKIEYIILSAGGFLGMGDDKVAIPWDKVKATPNVDRLTAEVSQSEVQRYAEAGKKSEDKGKTAESGRNGSQTQFARLDSESANDFMDKKVIGSNGEELGKVTDLFSGEGGKPMYVVVQDDSEKLHPVPAQLVWTNPEDGNLKADIDKQAFQNSPGFDESQLAQQRQWEPQVRGYYEKGLQGGQTGTRQSMPSQMDTGRQQTPPRQPQDMREGEQMSPPQGMGQRGEMEPRSRMEQQNR